MELDYIRSIQADVVVAGCGSAGFGAAVAAGRKGLKVVLLEKNNKIGGVLSLCPMMPFTGAYLKTNNQPIGGIISELSDRLFRMDPPAARVRESQYNTFGDELQYDHEKLMIAMYEMLEEANVEVLLNTTAFHVEMNHNHVESLLALQDEEIIRLLADVFIDCTGNGFVAWKAGVPFKQGDENGNVLGATLSFAMFDLTPEAFQTGGDLYRKAIVNKGIEEGKLDSEFIGAYIIQGVRDDIGIFNTVMKIGIDGTKSDQVLKASASARKMAHQMADYFIKHVSGFENGRLVYVGPLIGIRETRRFECLYEITIGDIMSQKHFPDGTVACNHPINELYKSMETGLIQLETDGGVGAYYTIPFRCFVPKKIENLLIAGRQICCDSTALASIRAMSICMLMGQACGSAAKIVHDKKIPVQQVDASELIPDLIRQGVRHLEN
ncbi:FAD-dependent oxidoreductase [Lachnospiraceae bacterium 62-35]